MSATSPAQSRWLFGPVPDLLLGCGLLYGLWFATLGFAGSEIRAHQPDFLLPLIVILVSMPHYGGTLLRVYEHREDRRGYVIFSVWATLLVFAAFVFGLYDALVGSWLFTLYITWSPWHYTGQNYGLGVMFLRRRGVDLTPLTKRLLYTSFLSSYALTFLVLHAATTGTSYDTAYSPLDYAGDEIAFQTLGIPRAFGNLAVPAAGLVYLASLAGCAFLLLRKATLRDLAPTAALVATQATWFTLPFAVRYFGVATGLGPLDDYLLVRDYILWVAIGHATQYLWVTTYYARASRGWSGYAHYLGKTLLTGIAIWTLPVIVFAPDALGHLPYHGGLALLVAAAVNLHHFVLDGAIWKLRNHRIAGVLIRSRPGESALPEPIGADDGRWLRRGVWAACALGVAVTGAAFWQTRVGFPGALARGDYAAAERILDAMAWVGRDDANERLRLGRALGHREELDAALAQYQRSIALRPTLDGFGEIARIHRYRGEWREVVRVCEQGLDYFPEHPSLLHAAGNAWLEPGEPEKARDLLERAVAVVPAHGPAVQALETARERVEEGPPGLY